MKIKRIEFVFQAAMDLAVIEHPQSKRENISELAIQLFRETQATDLIKRDAITDPAEISQIQVKVQISVQDAICELGDTA